MKMKFFLGLALISGLMFAGCSKEGDNNNGGLGEGAVVELKLSNPNSTKANLPEEVGDDAKNENTIDNVEIWVFKADEALSVYQNFTGAQANYKFVVPDAGANMKFLVSTNQTIGSIATYSEAITKLAADPIYTTTTVTEDGNTRTVPNRLVMAGWTTASVTPATSETSPVTPLTINIMRLVSKVEAPKEQTGGADQNVPAAGLKDLFERTDLLQTDVKFAMTGFVLINGLDKTSVFNNWNSTGIESEAWEADWRTGKVYLASAFKIAPPAEAGHYDEVYGGSKDGAGLFLTTPGTDVVYVYENTPKDDSDPVYFDKTTVYSCVIKGTLTDETSAVSMTRYWKANLIPDDNHKILRNTIYRMEIQGVNTVGYSTPKEAEEEVVTKQGNASVQISINVAKWRVKLQGTIL